MLIKTKKDDRPKYEILRDYERFPIEIDKTFVDNALSHLEMKLKDINQVIEAIYEQEPDLFAILKERLEYFRPFDTEPDSYGSFSTLAEEINKISEELKNGDDAVPTYKEIVRLEDLGFASQSYDNYWYQKTLEDTDEKEVIEEVFLREEPVYRKRTIFWDKTDYGKSSREIIYEDLTMDEELNNAIKNTKKELGE